MNETVILLSSLAMGTMIWIVIAKTWLLPWLNTLPRSSALALSIVPQAFRYIGLSFLIVGVTTAPLDTRFAYWAAYGDFTAGVLALIATILVLKNSSFAKMAVIIFSIVGLADFAIAIKQGLSYTLAGQMGATYFLPAFVVPFLLVAHIVTLTLLVKQHRDGKT